MHKKLNDLNNYLPPRYIYLIVNSDGTLNASGAPSPNFQVTYEM